MYYIMSEEGSHIFETQSNRPTAKELQQHVALPKNMCDGWYGAEHEYDGELINVDDFELCPDCLAEYRQDKYDQDEYEVSITEDGSVALKAIGNRDDEDMQAAEQRDF